MSGTPLVVALILVSLFPSVGDAQQGDASASRLVDGTALGAPTKLTDVRPIFPKNALAAGLAGTVVLEADIGPDGKVGNTRVISGYTSLAAAATVAVRQWTYTPTTVDGKAVPVIVTVTTKFSVEGAPRPEDALASLADPDPEIRASAIRWLGTYRPVKGKQRKALEDGLRDPSPMVQEAARKSLDVAAGQAPVMTADQEYLFIGPSSSSSLEKKATEAGRQGYGVRFVARFAKSFDMILKRDGAGTRNYRLITTSKLTTFVEELNEAGSEGFRVIPQSIKRTFAVVEQQRQGQRFSYSIAKGAVEAAKAIAEGRKRGLTLVGVLGAEGMSLSLKPVVLLEEVQAGSSSPAESGEREYRVVATNRTSTMEKELIEAATDGFHAIHAGVMAVVMEREPGSVAAAFDYRLAAMKRVATAERELNAAGADGFRIAVVPESTEEGVFVLHRTPKTVERFDYQIVRLRENTANDLLRQAEAAGYGIAVLFNDLVVFQRSIVR